MVVFCLYFCPLSGCHGTHVDTLFLYPIRCPIYREMCLKNPRFGNKKLDIGGSFFVSSSVLLVAPETGPSAAEVTRVG